MAPLHVELWTTNAPEGVDVYETKIGPHGKLYGLSFNNLIDLIRKRCGHERKYLEYKPR